MNDTLLNVLMLVDVSFIGETQLLSILWTTLIMINNMFVVDYGYILRFY